MPAIIDDQLVAPANPPATAVDPPVASGDPVAADVAPTDGDASVTPTLPSDRRRSHAYVAGVVLVVVFAGVLRAFALPSALPYTSYVDEAFVLRPAAHMVADRTWDPGWYRYPSLLIGLTAGATTAYSVVGDGVRSGTVVTDDAESFNVVAPAALIVIGRGIVWLCAVGTVLVTMLLAARLIGRRGAIIAGLIAAVLPALVSRSAIAIVDTPATFFAMASILCASWIGPRRRAMAVVVASGALAGLAATSKYQAAAVIVVPLVVIASTTAFDVRRRIRFGAAAIAAAGVAAVVTMPALLLHPRDVISDVKLQAAVYAAKATPNGYLQDLVSGLEVGWWLVVPAVIGVGLLVWRRPSRWVTIGWLVFVAIVGFAGTRSLYQVFRTVLPLVPFLAVAGAAAIVEGARYLGRAASLVAPVKARTLSLGLASVATAVLVVALFLGGVRPNFDTTVGLVDSRSQAIDWLAREVEPGQRVFVATELAIERTDLERIRGTVVLRETKELPEEVVFGPFDYVMTGAFVGKHAPPPPADAGPVVATFGSKQTNIDPNYWRGLYQVIEIRGEVP